MTGSVDHSRQDSKDDRSSSQNSLRQIARNSGWLMAGKIFGALASIVYLALAARFLQPEGFGTFVLIVGIAQLFAGVVGVQSWQIIVRFGALHVGKGDAAGARLLIHWCLLLEIAGAAGACILAVVCLQIAAPVFDWTDAIAGNATVFAIFILVCIRSTPMGVLRLDNRFAASAMADAMMPATRLIGAVIAVATGPTVASMLIAWAASEAASALTYWLFAAKGWTRGAPAPGLQAIMAAPDTNPELVRFAVTTNALKAFTSFQQQLPLLAIGAVAGAAVVGQFRLAHQLGQSLRLISELIGRAAFAELAHAQARLAGEGPGEEGKAVERKHPEALHRGIGRAALVAAAALAGLAIIVGYPALLLIGGPAYVSAYPLLVLVALAASIDLAAVGYEPFLLARGRGDLALYVRAASVLALVAGLFTLLPLLGATGGATAIVIASVAALLLGNRAVAKEARAK